MRSDMLGEQFGVKRVRYAQNGRLYIRRLTVHGLIRVIQNGDSDARQRVSRGSPCAQGETGLIGMIRPAFVPNGVVTIGGNEQAAGDPHGRVARLQRGMADQGISGVDRVHRVLGRGSIHPGKLSPIDASAAMRRRRCVTDTARNGARLSELLSVTAC